MCNSCFLNCDVGKWARVLAAYTDLKVNLAHFPMERRERQRRDKTLELVLKYDTCQWTLELTTLGDRTALPESSMATVDNSVSPKY